MLFTFDALAALAIISAATAIIITASNTTPIAREHSILATAGRDYLLEKYVHGITITEAQALQLTRKTVSETIPQNADNAATATAYAYLNPCSCPTTTCDIKKDYNSTCLYTQDINSSIKRNAWVTPE